MKAEGNELDLASSKGPGVLLLSRDRVESEMAGQDTPNAMHYSMSLSYNHLSGKQLSSHVCMKIQWRQIQTKTLKTKGGSFQSKLKWWSFWANLNVCPFYQVYQNAFSAELLDSNLSNFNYIKAFHWRENSFPENRYIYEMDRQTDRQNRSGRISLHVIRLLWRYLMRSMNHRGCPGDTFTGSPFGTLKAMLRSYIVFFF